MLSNIVFYFDHNYFVAIPYLTPLVFWLSVLHYTVHAIVVIKNEMDIYLVDAMPIVLDIYVTDLNKSVTLLYIYF